MHVRPWGTAAARRPRTMVGLGPMRGGLDLGELKKRISLSKHAPPPEPEDEDAAGEGGGGGSGGSGGDGGSGRVKMDIARLVIHHVLGPQSVGIMSYTTQDRFWWMGLDSCSPCGRLGARTSVYIENMKHNVIPRRHPMMWLAYYSSGPRQRRERGGGGGGARPIMLATSSTTYCTPVS